MIYRMVILFEADDDTEINDINEKIVNLVESEPGFEFSMAILGPLKDDGEDEEAGE
jgi:hypothetical protein